MGPLKSDLGRFLNNLDLTLQVQSLFTDRLSPLDKAHFGLLRKYLMPFPLKIAIQRVKHTVACFSEFLGKLNDASSLESFSMSLTSDVARDQQGLGLKELIRDSGNGLALLAEANPTGLVHYHVVGFDDFFIDALTSTKFGNDAIEVYRFPRFLVLQSLYPLTDLFAKVLESVANQYRQSRLSQFVDMVGSGRLRIEDFEAIDADCCDPLRLPGVAAVLQSLSAVALPSGGAPRFSVQLPSATVAFDAPAKAETGLLEGGRHCTRLLKRLAFEDALLLMTSMAAERTIVVVSERQAEISTALATLLALFRPLRWVFPLIHSLPRDCFDMLFSPVPIMVGVRTGAKAFLREVESRLEHGGSNCSVMRNMVVVFLDEGVLRCDPSVLTGNCLAANGDLLRRFEAFYRTALTGRHSRFVRLQGGGPERALALGPRSSLTKSLDALLDRPEYDKVSTPSHDELAKEVQVFSLAERVWTDSLRDAEDPRVPKVGFLKVLTDSQSFSFYMQERGEAATLGLRGTSANKSN